MDILEAGIRPAKIDKRGPLYTQHDVDIGCMKMIVSETFFERKAREMTSDTQKAIEKTEKITAEFSTVLGKFLDVERNFSEQSKRASGNVRDAAEKLSQGMLKIEKAANFDRLEKYVGLLERAASAMTVLAELEATGKLEKIAGAIR